MRWWCGLCSSAVRETGVAFVGVAGAARETDIAFVGVNGLVLGGWSRALVSWVSSAGVSCRALVSRVSSAGVSRRALVSWVSNASVGAHVVAHLLHARPFGVARLFERSHESGRARPHVVMMLDVTRSAGCSLRSHPPSRRDGASLAISR